MGEFVRVLKAADLPPGQGLELTVGDKPVALFNVGGEFRAIGNRCVTARFDAYYARGALPREGAVCPKDRALFSGPGRLRSTATWRPQAG